MSRPRRPEPDRTPAAPSDEDERLRAEIRAAVAADPALAERVGDVSTVRGSRLRMAALTAGLPPRRR